MSQAGIRADCRYFGIGSVGLPWICFLKPLKNLSITACCPCIDILAFCWHVFRYSLKPRWNRPIIQEAEGERSCGLKNKIKVYCKRNQGDELMLLATIRIAIPPKKRREALEILNLVAERTRIQPGCLSFRVYHEEQEEAVLMVEEVWKNQEDLDQHLRSDDYRNVLFVTEMALESPEIRFHEISHSAGVEIIEKARGCVR
jgi:quinol monooxygenase YgiN